MVLLVAAGGNPALHSERQAMSKRTKTPKKQTAAEIELESIRTEFNILPGKSIAGHIEWLKREITELKSRDKRAICEIMAIREVLGAVSTESVLDAAKRVMRGQGVGKLDYQAVLRILLTADPLESTDIAILRMARRLRTVTAALEAIKKEEVAGEYELP